MFKKHKKSKKETINRKANNNKIYKKRKYDMKRKLFCEYGPVAYEISLWKEALLKDIEDYIIKKYKIAKKKSYDRSDVYWLFGKCSPGNGVIQPIYGAFYSDAHNSDYSSIRCYQVYR